MHVSSRLASRVAVLALSLGAVAVPLATQANAVTPPALGATPSAHLVDGQTISVTGTDFPTGHGGTAYIVECSGLAGSTDCDASTATPATLDVSGNFTATDFTVETGAVGTGGHFCPSMTAAGSCYLVATSNPADQTDVTSIGSIAIDFAPVLAVSPNKNVKDGDTLSVLGYGFPVSTSPVYVVECAGSVPSTTGCDGGTLITPQPATDANGVFTGNITVHGGAVGDGTCNAGQSCLITATTDISATPAPDTSAIAPITFANVVTKIPTTLFAEAKAKHGKVKVSGTISAAGKGVKALKVTVYERAKGTKKWKKAGTATSAKSGGFAVKGLKQKSKPEQYQAKHAKQTIGKNVYGTSKSSVSTVK